MIMIERLDEKVRGILCSQAGVSITIGILFSQIAMTTWGYWVHIVYIVLASFFFMWAVVWVTFILIKKGPKGVEEFANCFGTRSILLIAPPVSAILIYAHFINNKIDNSYLTAFFMTVVMVWFFMCIGLIQLRRRH